MSHVERMKEEAKGLRIKVGKLGVFTSDTNSVFMSLAINERDDMLRQLWYMEGYLNVLERRIARASGEVV